MTTNSDIEQLMISVLLGEAGEDDEAQLNLQIQEDPALQAEFIELKQTLGLVERNLEIPDPGEAFWDEVWPELQSRVMSSEKQSTKLLGWLNADAWAHFWKPAMQIAGVAAMLLVGVFVGTTLTHQEFQQFGGLQIIEDPVVRNPQISREMDDMIMTVADSPLSRSERALNDFMRIKTSAAGGDSGWSLDPGKQDEYVTLADELMMLRSDSSDPRIAKVSPVLEELELIISEIARLESSGEGAHYEITMIQNGIKERGLQVRLKRVRQLIVPTGVIKNEQ